MKKAAILIDEEIRRRKLDILKVGDIHDEFQFDILAKDADAFIDEICPSAFARAGEFFRYNVPIECEAKKGLTWAETH